jgi:hypothetical protein
LEEKARLSREIDEGKIAPPGVDQTSAPGGSSPRTMALSSRHLGVAACSRR